MSVEWFVFGIVVGVCACLWIGAEVDAWERLQAKRRRDAARAALARRRSLHADCLSATEDERRRYAEFRRRIDEDVRGVLEQTDREVES